jgi:hypothetical protein
MAPPPAFPTRNSPRFQQSMPSQVCSKSSYGPQTALTSIHQRFCRESPGQRLDDTGLFQNEEKDCSGNKDVSKRLTVPQALSSCMQMTNLPVTQDTKRLKTHIRPYYGPKKAIAPTNPCCPQSLRHRHLEVLRRHRCDTVHVKCSNLNAISKAKPNDLLAFVLDPSKRAYSPCTVTVTPHDDGSPEKVREKLGVCYPPRKKCEQHTRCSPVWFERNSMNAHQVGTYDKGHMSHYNNPTCSCVCLRTSPGVLTTCRVKWYVPTQFHQVLLGALLLYVPYHWLGQVGTNQISRV